jgi:hypothetical protein
MPRAVARGICGNHAEITGGKNRRPKRNRKMKKTPRPGTAAWKRFIANAMAKNPADRTPQETVAIRKETTGSVLLTEVDRFAAARELGVRAAHAGITENPFATPSMQQAWETARLETLKG